MSGPLNLSEGVNPSRGEKYSVTSPHSLPPAVLAEGDPDMAANPASTDEKYLDGATLNYLNRGIEQIRPLGLPDPSEPTATGTTVGVTWSYTGAVG